MGWRPVLAQYSNPYAETVHVAIRDVETGAVQVVKSNRIHPFFAQREAQGAGLYSPAAMTPPPPASEGHVYRGAIPGAAWVDAQHLQPGDRLLNADGTWAEVVSTRIEAEPLQAYNLTVAGAHTYFVSGDDGSDPVWVHNDCWDNDQLPGTFVSNGARTPDGRDILEGPNGERAYRGHDGRYYDANVHLPTKSDGTVLVDRSNVQRGTAEYEALNRPRPNTSYELSDGTTFRTNASGQVEEVTWTPIAKRGRRDWRQTDVGRTGLPDDQGGHIQACSLGGTCDRFNLFPQGISNNTTYKVWENTIRSAVRDGKDVRVTTRLIYGHAGNPTRPTSVVADFVVDGSPSTQVFPN